MTLDLRCGRWQDVLADVTCDLLCTDTPYSAKTHAGHRDGSTAIGPAYMRTDRRTGAVYSAGTSNRNDIDYAHWTPDDVRAFVAFWAPRTRGWMVSLTDDVLFPVWRDAMRDAGRTVFQDVPAIISGMTVRLCGDGPSSWAIHCVVSRPSTAAAAKWGTLPGGYYGPSERQAVTGGKPLWLMKKLVSDYSRKGDVVADPCMGGGTTGAACIALGRGFVGAEMDPETFRSAKRRLVGLSPDEARTGEQPSLCL